MASWSCIITEMQVITFYQARNTGYERGKYGRVVEGWRGPPVEYLLQISMHAYMYICLYHMWAVSDCTTVQNCEFSDDETWGF